MYRNPQNQMMYLMGIASALKDLYQGYPPIFIFSSKSNELWGKGYKRTVLKIWKSELEGRNTLTKRKRKVSRQDTPSFLMAGSSSYNGYYAAIA